MRGRGISGPAAARDRSKRSSATRMSRSTSSRLEASTCRYSSGVRDARSATSIPPFSAVSGVRSSWAASAAKRRICRKASSSRASMPLSVSASRSSSSWVPCRPMRWCRSSAVMRRAAAVISSTGRSAFRAMTAPPAAASPTPSGIKMTSVSR